VEVVVEAEEGGGGGGGEGIAVVNCFTTSSRS